MNKLPEIEPQIFRGKPTGYVVASYMDYYVSVLQFDTYSEAREFMLRQLIENTKPEDQANLTKKIQEHPVEYGLRDKWNQHYLGWSNMDAWNEREDVCIVISPIYRTAKEQYED